MLSQVCNVAVLNVISDVGVLISGLYCCCIKCNYQMWVFLSQVCNVAVLNVIIRCGCSYLRFVILLY